MGQHSRTTVTHLVFEYPQTPAAPWMWDITLDLWHHKLYVAVSVLTSAGHTL